MSDSTIYPDGTADSVGENMSDSTIYPDGTADSVGENMSDSKIYPADTVDIYGNVWQTVGENIRNGAKQIPNLGNVLFDEIKRIEDGGELTFIKFFNFAFFSYVIKTKEAITTSSHFKIPFNSMITSLSIGVATDNRAIRVSAGRVRDNYLIFARSEEAGSTYFYSGFFRVI